MHVCIIIFVYFSFCSFAAVGVPLDLRVPTVTDDKSGVPLSDATDQETDEVLNVPNRQSLMYDEILDHPYEEINHPDEIDEDLYDLR